MAALHPDSVKRKRVIAFDLTDTVRERLGKTVAWRLTANAPNADLTFFTRESSMPEWRPCLAVEALRPPSAALSARDLFDQTAEGLRTGALKANELLRVMAPGKRRN